MKKLFEVQQKITFLVNEYRVFKDDQLAGFVRQKRLALREQFTLYGDEEQSVVLASCKARRILDFQAAYDILDSEGKHLATVKKEFKQSLLSSTWNIYSDDGLKKLQFRVSESNQTVAILRRLWGFIPFINEIPFPIKFHFSIYSDDKEVGKYQKLTLIRDHYALYLGEPYIQNLDERAWMMFAVLLDAMQSR